MKLCSNSLYWDVLSRKTHGTTCREKMKENGDYKDDDGHDNNWRSIIFFFLKIFLKPNLQLKIVIMKPINTSTQKICYWTLFCPSHTFFSQLSKENTQQIGENRFTNYFSTKMCSQRIIRIQQLKGHNCQERTRCILFLYFWIVCFRK